MNNDVLSYRFLVPTGVQEIHECATPKQRILSLYVTNTTTGTLTVTLGVKRAGTTYEVLTEVEVYATATKKETLEWLPGAFILTKSDDPAGGAGFVNDIVTIQASGVGLKGHLSVEVIRP